MHNYYCNKIITLSTDPVQIKTEFCEKHSYGFFVIKNDNCLTNIFIFGLRQS